MVCVDRDGSTLAAHPGSGRSNDRSGHCRWRVDRAGEDVTRTRRSGISQAVPSAFVGASCNAGASDWRGDRPGCSGAFAGLIAGLHRAGNGILTIQRGTVPLTLFGSQNYGYRLALIGAPARVARAAAPLVSSLSIELWSVGVLLFSSGLCVAGCGALLLVRAADRQTNS